MERFLNIIFRIAIVPAACLAFFSCSTTRVLQDGEYRLQKNKILITNQDEKKFNANDLEPYIKQSPNSYFIFGWNPFLNIYNWSNGKGNGWDRFVRKIGEPPVVYDPDMVESSVSNITDHLTFLGYYNSDVRARIDVRKKRVKVTYNVTLGKQFPIKGIAYHVPEGELAADFWADTSSLSVRPGDYMSEYSLDKETDMLSKYFRDNGFYGFTKNYISYVADTLSCPDSAFLEMHIREYTRNETEQDSGEPDVQLSGFNASEIFTVKNAISSLQQRFPNMNLNGLSIQKGDRYTLGSVGDGVIKLNLGFFNLPLMSDKASVLWHEIYHLRNGHNAGLETKEDVEDKFKNVPPNVEKYLKYELRNVCFGVGVILSDEEVERDYQNGLNCFYVNHSKFYENELETYKAEKEAFPDNMVSDDYIEKREYAKWTYEEGLRVARKHGF